jgi:hypothetical protein
MRIPSGVTDQYLYLVGVDATDLKTRETSLSSFTVYRSRNGAAAAAMSSPTVNETDSSNMPGVYELLLDEDMTIAAGNDSEEMVFHITHSGMAPVTRVIELYRPKITTGETLTVSSGAVSTCTTNSDMRGTDSAATAAALATVDGIVDAILVDTGTTLDGKVTTIDGIVDAILADTGTDGVTLSAAICNKIADHVIRRNLATALASGDGDTKTFRSVGGATAKQVNKIAVEASTLNIYESDDSTVLGQQSLSTDATANPITAADTV